MDILDKLIQEWSWRTEKGYPDFTNEDDLRILREVFGINLKETPLTPKELGKQNSKKKVERVDILIQKIKKGEPLELDKGEETFTVYDPKGEKVAELQAWTPDKGPVTLQDKDGNTITTSKLKKTADFGGGEDQEEEQHRQPSKNLVNVQ